jgi:dTMP kinase
MIEKQSHQAGRFIVIEGIDGAGTTTQAKMLVDWLVSSGRGGVFTSEPSAGPIGLLLRQILSKRTIARHPDGSLHQINNETIALLFAADRLDHLECEVVPLVLEGQNVVSDRYYHSSFTYQSLLGDMDWIRSLNSPARAPDVTYLLDISAEIAAKRRMISRSGEELYEDIQTQKKLENSYRDMVDLLSDEVIVVIDGSKSAESIHQTIKNDLSTRFGWSEIG